VQKCLVAIMKKKVVLKRFHHRGRWRIGMVFDYNQGINDLIKTIPGRSYSDSRKCWYVDDSEDSIRMLLKVFRDRADVDISSLASPSCRDEQETLTDSEPEKIIEDSFLVSSEILADTDKNVNAKETPGAFVDTSGISSVVKKVKSRYGPVVFRIGEADGSLTIKFEGIYDQLWIDELRSYGRLSYNKSRKEFLLPYSRLTADSLSDFFATAGVEVKVVRTTLPGDLQADRTELGNEVRSRRLSDAAEVGVADLKAYLEKNRYSPRTVESYVAQLELFFKYFAGKDPSEITHNELSDFVNDFIIRLGFSGSFQNQVISAIKTYYEISGNGRIVPQFLERPRRSRALPKVFSKEEVGRILTSARNDKHKLLLWLIYSCGLRRSEVTNIRLNDLDRERGILHIREGKGMVDRIVPVSEKVWDKLDIYLSSYNPVVYLFEGQGGGRYSSESVYRVFKEAMRKAGISRDVGVHSLRHSYATHLHESGLDIRYIQELLGHKSSRTTEIYTHVSRRNLIAVRSPIDDLDIK